MKKTIIRKRQLGTLTLSLFAGLLVSSNAVAERSYSPSYVKGEEQVLTPALPGKTSRATEKLITQLPALPGCNTKSHALIKHGDRYYDVERRDEPRRNEAITKKLESHFADLIGGWSGQAVETVCYQSGDSRLNVFDVEEFLVSTNNESQERGTRRATRAIYIGDNLATFRNDRVRIATDDATRSSGEIRTITITHFPPADDYQEIEQVSDHEFRLITRYRERTTPTGNTVLREREDWLTSSRSTLTWRTDWYTNGHYSGSDFNFLKR